MPDARGELSSLTTIRPIGEGDPASGSASGFLTSDRIVRSLSCSSAYMLSLGMTRELRSRTVLLHLRLCRSVVYISMLFLPPFQV